MAGDAHPLALAAGQSGGAGGGLAQQAGLVQGLGRPQAPGPRPGQRRQGMAGIGQTQQHVVDHRQAVDQGMVLEDGGGAPPCLVQGSGVAKITDAGDGDASRSRR